MNIVIETPIQRPAEEVWQGFTQELFLELSPPFPKLKLDRFDGCQVGDEIHLCLDFGVYRSKWVSHIVEQADTEHEIYFVDVSENLPFPLQRWTHKHRILKTSVSTCIITDDIEYGTFSKLTDALIYPLMWAQFVYRRPIYKSFFEG